MTYNPDIHHRRSIRLRDYDYSSAGAYFVTIRTENREGLFGNVTDGDMRLNNFGVVVAECWRALPTHFPAVELDEFVVMPNHFHGIFVLDTIVGAQHAAPGITTPGPICSVQKGAQHAAPLQTSGHTNVMSGSLGAIVRSFKSAASKRINEIRNDPGSPVWQRNYYERIIRNDHELERIREYIVNNPLQWTDDSDNPMNTPS